MPRRTEIGILLAALAIWAGNARAQTPGLPGEFPAMAMSARVQSDTLWIGEPAALTCRVVNWLGADLTLVGSFGLRGRQTEVRVVEKGEPQPPYWGPFEQAPSPPQRIALRYAKAFEYGVTLLYEPDMPGHMLFRRPGDYAILVRQEMGFIDHMVSHIRVNRFAATAQTRRFRVVEPPADQAGALAILEKRPAILRDMQMRHASAANWEPLQEMVERYPGSRYAPWCLDAMANLALQLAPASQEELRKAESLLERLVRDFPEYPFHDEARIQLADVLMRTGSLDRAAGIARSLIAEDEDNMFRFRRSAVMLAFLGRRLSAGHQVNDRHWYLFPNAELPLAWFQRAGEEVSRE